METQDFNKKFFSTQIKIRDYFRQKTKKHIAASTELLSEHCLEIGTHREILIQNYLEEIIPKRFSIGNGTIYGKHNGAKSKQTDIVIWDSLNYPILKSLGHNAYFAETVKAAIEVKSSWSTDNFEDILNKTASIKSIVQNIPYLNLEERITIMENRFEALLENESYSGFLKSPNPIATIAVVFRGGENFSLENIISKRMNILIDDQFPDLMLFLEAGKVFTKEYSFNNGFPNEGIYRMRKANEDALLFFTCDLLRLISSHSIDYDTPFFLDDYVLSDNATSEYIFKENLYSEKISFPINGFSSGTGGFGKY